jgi:hypothetical protein
MFTLINLLDVIELNGGIHFGGMAESSMSIHAIA